VSTFRAWSLVEHPTGTPGPECFALKTFPLPPLQDEEVLVENTWLSVEPSGRARMDKGRLPVGAFVVGEPMFGRALGRVVESRARDVKVGDIVGHGLGWRDRSVAPASALMRIPQADVPVQAFLGILGFTGLVGYVGIVDIAGVRAGDTVFVSGAAGAVGSAAVQFARIKGAGHVIGSAGGADKCAWLKSIGCDATIDYRAEKDLSAALRRSAPEGIDVYFDNVGGAHLAAALDNARDHARFAECGMISGYNSGETNAPAQMFQVVTKRLRVQGFGGPDIMDRIGPYQREAIPLVASNALQSRETVFEGLEATPGAFLGLFSGANMGKMLVRL
jgi:NADPH-dependent curcumin reductase CurA